MKITLDELIELEGCKNGVQRFVDQSRANNDEPVDVSTLVGGLNTYSDFSWLMRKKVSRKRVLRLVFACASIHAHLLEPHANTKQYAIIVKFLENPQSVDSWDRQKMTLVAETVRREIGTVTQGSPEEAVGCAAEAVYWAAQVSIVPSATRISKVLEAVVKAGSKEQVDKMLVEMFNEYE